MLFYFQFVVKVLACVFIADFLSGFFHWLEDSYGESTWPITGKYITQPNILHHYDPRDFINGSWFDRAQVIMIIAAVILFFAWATDILNWMFVLVALIGINANEIHKWAHSSKKENGELISFFQKLGVLQSPSHHAVHHKHEKNTQYCVVTNYLNPALDGVHFWSALETIIYRLFKVKRRVDPTLR